MPSIFLNATLYKGPLLSLSLLSANPTILLTDLGPPSPGTLEDNEGTLSVTDAAPPPSPESR